MKKRRNIFCLLGLLTVCVASATAGVVAYTSANANAVEGWSQSFLDAEYDYKETLAVTPRSYTKNGATHEASVIVCFPDGSISDAKEIVLDQAGVYTVKYSVQAGDKVYADSEEFLVNYPAYDISSEKSSVSYGTPKGATTAGVQARIAQNDSLVFTQYIDFTKIKADDQLVTGYVTPDVAGSADFSELIFTFTDAEDPSVYLKVHHYGYDWTYNTYVAAHGQNQVPVGMHQSEGLKTNNGYGLWSYVPFNSVGQTGIVAPDTTQFFVSMNYQTMEMYSLGFPGNISMYADLDNSEYVQNVWTGFPSGKARLSVSAYGYNGTTANVCITNVYGIDDLSNSVYLDTDKPTITVDEAFANEMPKALVGHDYVLPTATAYDAYARDCEVTASVWFNYGMESTTKVPVKDGKIAIKKAGTYGIVYEAVDKIGNSSSVVKYVTAYENLETADFELPVDKQTSANAGEWVNVPMVNVDSITGGSGKKTVKTYIEINGKREEIQAGFRALELGTYKVIYEITDYVGQKTEKGYDVSVTAGDTPILERDFDVYPTYISDVNYVLPSYYAYSMSGDKLQRELCDVVITDANGATTYKAGETAKITIANQGDPVQFEIKSQGVTLASHTANGVLAWVQEEVGLRLHAENYLYGEGFACEKTSDGMVLTATDSGFGFTFANAQSSKYAVMKFTNVNGATADTLIRVSLVDAFNHDLAVSMVLGYDGKNAYMEVDGVRKTFAGVSFNSDAAFEITYENGSFSIGKETLAVKDFVAFESDKMFINVSFENGAENGGFTFAELGNVRFNTVQTDRIAPVILAQHEIGGTWKPGSFYTIYAPVAYDVYSPNMDYSLTVTDSNGDAVVDVNGVLLENVDPSKDYVIKLDKIGQYLVSYSATEDKEFVKRVNSSALIYTLNVSDEEKPVITWKGSFVTEAKVGDMLVVPNYTVSDNYTAEKDIIVRVFVEAPTSEVFMLPGNAIVVNHVGNYKIRVMVVDGAGNITNETYYVNVKSAE
ncbi:MAG: DUF5011 domain-containing protein [Clostridiales bacterium]|nr:DUF5011 domain-containing protein [Clostridiales bacterium]